MWATFQAPGPPDGLVETTTSPSASTATQSSVVGHETASSSLSTSTLVTDQRAVSLVALADISTLPAVSTATHHCSSGQETPVSALEPSTFVIRQAAEPPVGLVEVTTS